ncbi:MAG: shikimate dehydrogenase [Proteobacteria bacterium]|nr:shikimate dehydrogenase [Pseudomonadota bacterium]
MRSISNITTSTKLCALIGNPVAHSLSPAIHNRAFEELGLDFVYLAFRVENIQSAISGMRGLESFRGLSVTIPHKVAILEHLDEISEVDGQIGSVNTVVNDNGRLIGSGSDGPGARQALEENGVKTANQSVVILGSGGAARAIAFNLAHETPPSSLVILGIIEEELKELTRDLLDKTGVNASCEILTKESISKHLEKTKVLIHATPCGMHPRQDESLVPKELMRDDLSIMDIVYNPLKTKLIRDAESKGLKTVLGVDMFVNQAVVQFELWTGKKAPKEVMRRVVLDHLKQL